MPTSVNANDLLVVCGRVAGVGAVAVTGGGWTISQTSADGSDDVTFWMYRNTLALDTEDSATITVTHGTFKMCAVSLAIAGAPDPATQAPQSATAFAANAVVDPPSLTPTGGAKDYLWVGQYAFDGEQGTTPGNGIPSGAANPTNYSVISGAGTGTAGVAATNCQCALAYRQLNAASEDPSSWTAGAGTLNWEAYTIAVHPGAAGAPPAAPAITQARDYFV
jgi:hypothetical protein